MTLRDSLIEIGADELRARGVKAADDPLGTMEAIADRLGLDLPERRRAWLFVRQTRWVSPTLAGRAGGAIVATRTPRGRANRSRTWYMQARTAGAQIVTWEWMLQPGRWRQGLEAEVAFAASIGAVAICLNAEPASKKSEKGTALDWRGQHAELDAYASTLRDLCDRHGLELWVTGWALPSAAPTFPWLELLAAAHVCLPQPYEVHGRAGPAYVAQVRNLLLLRCCNRLRGPIWWHARFDAATVWPTAHGGHMTAP